VVAAWRRRGEQGVSGRGGVLRASGFAVALWFAPALFGAVTVFLENPAWATVVHKALAAALLAVLAACTVRAGGLGGARALAQRATPKAVRGASVAAGLALAAVLMGAMTAKIAGAAVACRGFPFCGDGSLGGGAQHVQLTHRMIAYLVAFHVLGFFAFAKRREAPVVVAAAQVALGVVMLQIALGAAMVLGGFPPVLRSLHQATGMALWLTTFTMAYLARVALTAGTREAGSESGSRVPLPASHLPAAGSNA
jgi:heme A synthase